MCSRQVKTKIMTEYLENADSNSSQTQSVVKNALETSEVAAAVAFLLSDASSGINGRSILMGQVENDY